jgi:3-oxoacyl-(acyl-carrier-protein) synthase
MRRVVITGLGAVSPFGVGTEAFWHGLVEGRSATKHLSAVTASPLFEGFDFASRVIADVEDFDAARRALPVEVQKLGRFIQFAVLAALEAIKESCLRTSEFDRERFGIALSTAICGTPQLETEFLEVTRGTGELVNPQGVRPDFYLAAMSNTHSIVLSSLTGARGPCTTLSTGCIGGIDAIGYAFEAIQANEADVMLAGASEAPVTPITVAAFDVIHCLARAHNDRPEAASRPFDARRDGFVLGEGCGVVVIEDLEHARARGARPRAEVVGHDLTCNAQHMTDLVGAGADLSRAIVGSVQNAGLDLDRVDHVNAHGSSTQQNDRCETNAIKLALGERAGSVPVNSIKSMIGHPLSAAGALEVIACVLALERRVLPPTINYEEPDPACDLDYVPNEARDWNGDVAVSCASGFSGVHSAIVLRPFRDWA